MFRWHLRNKEGVESYEVRHAERLTESVRAGHGVLLTPNHSRTADPIVLAWLAAETDLLFYGMASAHLFFRGWSQRFLMRLMGAFSVNREGADRPAINWTVDSLTKPDRPVVVFGEGTATRTNDRLTELMDGLSFMARTAAKKREKTDQGKVVIHPVAIKYVFKGDLKTTADPILTDIESRLTFRPLTGAPLIERVARIGRALLGLKEIEYFGDVQTGTFPERQKRLVERLMVPVEEEWLGRPQTGGIVGRIKNVRMQIFPPIARGEVTPQERERRYRQLADTYLAQQVAFHPDNYLTDEPTIERILETVERFEEDLTDKARVNRPWHVIIDVGPAIEVSSRRDKSIPGDPITDQIRETLTTRLNELSKEGTPYRGE